MKIALASDHGGYALKETVKNRGSGPGYRLRGVG